MTNKDIRIFFNKHTNKYILANDNKYRRLINQGYAIQQAKDNSHGHIRNKKDAEDMKRCILSNKRTKARNLYTLKCYLRVTDKSYKHHDWIKELLDTKIDKMR